MKKSRLLILIILFASKGLYAQLNYEIKKDHFLNKVWAHEKSVYIHYDFVRSITFDYKVNTPEFRFVRIENGSSLKEFEFKLDKYSSTLTSDGFWYHYENYAVYVIYGDIFLIDLEEESINQIHDEEVDMKSNVHFYLNKASSDLYIMSPTKMFIYNFETKELTDNSIEKLAEYNVSKILGGTNKSLFLELNGKNDAKLWALYNLDKEEFKVLQVPDYIKIFYPSTVRSFYNTENEKLYFKMTGAESENAPILTVLYCIDFNTDEFKLIIESKKGMNQNFSWNNEMMAYKFMIVEGYKAGTYASCISIINDEEVTSYDDFLISKLFSKDGELYNISIQSSKVGGKDNLTKINKTNGTLEVIKQIKNFKTKYSTHVYMLNGTYETLFIDNSKNTKISVAVNLPEEFSELF